MCGLCGCIGGRVSPERFQRALDKMKQRGPDQTGTAEDSRSDVVLGHQRLSIIDLSEAGRQPMRNEDGTVLLVFNGEIYNHHELRRQLSGHHFVSQSDTEVLVHGFEEWGIDGLLKRITGMFAFAIWDSKSRSAYIARDHLGKKPLYYAVRGSSLFFSSTLPSLLALLPERPSVDDQAILEFLDHRCIHAPRTIFQDVFKIRPAHFLKFQEGTVRLLRYWSLPTEPDRSKSEEDFICEIEADLLEAVRTRMEADVPVGAFLSGGLDSSLIVAMMKQVGNSPPVTVSIGFEGEVYNELPYARKVATQLGSTHFEHMVGSLQTSCLPDLIFQYGEPFGDHAALPTYHLAAQTRKHVTVALTGDGGDECFAGYDTSKALAAAQYLHFLPVALRNSMQALSAAGVLRGFAASRRMAATLDLAQNGYRYDPKGTRTIKPNRNALVAPRLIDAAKSYEDQFQAAWGRTGGKDWVNRGLKVDFETLLPDDFLVKLDVATMAHSLEARSPFLDLRVVQKCARIPGRLKLKNFTAKHLLKKIGMKWLPREIVHRRKHGFSSPVEDWFRGDLGTVARGILLSHAARQRGFFEHAEVERMLNAQLIGAEQNGQYLWLMLNLELWCQMFLDGTIGPTDKLTA